MRRFALVPMICVFLVVLTAGSQASQQANVPAAMLQTSAPNSEPGEGQGPGQRMRGYSDADARTERAWETKFRAIPAPQKMREYMQRLSARPHHLGSPYDQDNAQWLLNTFKSWGLDAHIETFEVLFPTPKQRLVELLEPVNFTAKLQEPTSPTIPPATSIPSSFPPTTPTRLTATLPRRWCTSTTASRPITSSSIAWAFR